MTPRIKEARGLGALRKLHKLGAVRILVAPRLSGKNGHVIGTHVVRCGQGCTFIIGVGQEIGTPSALECRHLAVRLDAT